MRSILSVIEKTYRNQFKRNYLKNYGYVLISLLDFWSLHLILNILKKKMTLVAYVFPKL